jgi:peroxiredoxin/Tfp pilus assembly protein PilF
MAAQVDESHQAELRHELGQADIALQERDYEAARQHYARANELAHAHSIEALRGLAWAHLRLEDTTTAVSDAQAALTLAGNDAERGEVRNLMGAILFSEYVTDKTRIDKLHASETEFRSAIQLNPNLAGAYYNLGTALLKDSQDAEGARMLRKYLELAPAASNAEQVGRLIADPRLSRGELAPMFSLRDTSGQIISTESLHGRIVLLDFWASWCGPCIASLPDIRKLAHQYPADQFVLIGINEDEDLDAWRKFLSKQHMPWPQLRDKNWTLFHAFGLAPERKIVVPAYVVLDRDGLVLHKARGLEDASSLAKEIEQALAQKLR